ncbi:MAG TPA: transglutaminase domain-containing protein [Thermoanaerobaculia bacterium]|nr:transglutaminase domain-containing protein [Thermoanaerobaculia bacterium]
MRLLQAGKLPRPPARLALLGLLPLAAFGAGDWAPSVGLQCEADLGADLPRAVGAPSEADPAVFPNEPTEQRWYLLELGGRSAGWAAERWWSRAGEIVTEAELSLRLARAGTELEIAMAARFVETATGEPVSLWLRRALGNEPIETTYRFLPDRVTAETVQGARVRREDLALPAGAWLTPAEARRAIRRHHAAGDSDYTLRTVDPLEGLEPVTVIRTRLGAGASPETAELWEEKLSSAPGMASIVKLDAAGEMVQSTTEILGLEAVLRRSDRATALAALASDAGPRPEVLRPTLIRPDRSIQSPERTVRALYELSLPGGGEIPDLPDGGGQRVERQGDRLLVAVAARPPEGRVEPNGGRGGERIPPPDQDGAPDLARYLAASTYLDHDDPQIRRLLGAVVPGDADPRPVTGEAGTTLARSLTELVRHHVQRKDLDTGFATASEVARSGSGDCTEHSVLLAALLRAAGIPSRAVTGLVYLEDFAGAEGVFGYHMWVQAWAEGRWLDLDATLPGGFDATHIALALSDLAGPELDGLLPLVGRLAIRVLEVEP